MGTYSAIRFYPLYSGGVIQPSILGHSGFDPFLFVSLPISHRDEITDTSVYAV